jgi:aryl-alcohol dehydrogenase-like predicted oxidoreductase
MRDVSNLEAKDIRRNMPRFYPEIFPRNLPLLDGYEALARQAGCTPAQLALAWLLAKDENILPIPGTISIALLEENMGADSVVLEESLIAELEKLINQETVVGARYNDANQVEIDTEEF